MKIDKILFPIHFSEREKVFAPHVKAPSRRFGASITLLHMVEPLVMPYGPLETLAFPSLQPTKLVEIGEERLQSFAEAEFGGEATTALEIGDAAVSIASLAETW